MKEWRIIGNKGVINYADEDIDRIIFGVNMPELQKNDLRSLVENKNMNFFQAVKSKRQFAVEIIKLD